CDSRQIYEELPLLSACPTKKEIEEIPHELYAFLKGTERYDAMRYVHDVARLLPFIEGNNQTPIFTGGTGFYIDALINGLSAIPEVSTCVIHSLNRKKDEKGIEKLYEELQRKDPVLAAKLSPTDSQRILRGLAVYDSAKRPLSYFQSLPKQKIIDRDFEVKIISRPVEELNTRIEKRIEKMFKEGVLKEVLALLKKNYSETAPVMQSIGVPEIRAFLNKEITETDAKEQILIRTRQYAKRQRTWFRRFDKKI
ncbi:MAG: tRNA (adenosine(37)-N6)-dimethylallyltransferase MiaA, partial [Alphaproteobacteria bacterium]